MPIKSRGYSPSDVAKWFINRVDRDSGDNITHLKLQKLVYYAQAWWLANEGEALFEEEMQAWTHGPVVPSVWQEYKGNSWDSLKPEGDDKPSFPDEITRFLDVVYTIYGKFGAKHLEDLTHNEDPWIQTRGVIPMEAKCTHPIKKELLKDYYGKRIQK